MDDPVDQDDIELIIGETPFDTMRDYLNFQGIVNEENGELESQTSLKQIGNDDGTNFLNETGLLFWFNIQIGLAIKKNKVPLSKVLKSLNSLNSETSSTLELGCSKTLGKQDFTPYYNTVSEKETDLENSSRPNTVENNNVSKEDIQKSKNTIRIFDNMNYLNNFNAIEKQQEKKEKLQKRLETKKQQQPFISMVDNISKCDKLIKDKNTYSQDNNKGIKEVNELLDEISRESSTLSSTVSTARTSTSASGDNTPINTEVDTEFTKKLSTRLEQLKNCEYAEDINLIKDLLNEILKSIKVYKDSLDALQGSSLSDNDKEFLERLFSNKLQGKTLSGDQLKNFNELATDKSLQELKDQYNTHNKNILALNEKVYELTTKDDLKVTEENIIAKNEEQIDTAKIAILEEIKNIPEEISKELKNFINEPNQFQATLTEAMSKAREEDKKPYTDILNQFQTVIPLLTENNNLLQQKLEENTKALNKVKGLLDSNKSPELTKIIPLLEELKERRNIINSSEQTSENNNTASILTLIESLESKNKELQDAHKSLSDKEIQELNKSIRALEQENHKIKTELDEKGKELKGVASTAVVEVTKSPSAEVEEVVEYVKPLTESSATASNPQSSEKDSQSSEKDSQSSEKDSQSSQKKLKILVSGGGSSQEVPVTTNDSRALINYAEKLAPTLVTKDNNDKRIIDVIVPGPFKNKNEVVNKLTNLDIKNMEEGENKYDDDDDTEPDQDKFDAEEDKQAEIEKATNKKKEEKEEEEKQQEEDEETERKDAVTKTEIDAEIKKEDETKNQTSNGAVKDLISDELHSIKLTKEAIGDGLKTKRTVVNGEVVDGKPVSLTKPQMEEIRNKIKEKISKSDISAEDIKKDPERVKRILKESFTVTDLESIDSLKHIDIPETLVTNLIDQTTDIAKTVQKEKFDDTIRRINKGIIGKSFLNHGKGNHDDSLKDLYSLLGFRNNGAPKFLKDDMEFLDIMMEVNIHRNMISKEFRRLQGYMTYYVQSKNEERGNHGSHDLKSTIINKAKQILRKKINEKKNSGNVEPKYSLKNSLDYLQKLSENLELYSLRLRLLTVKKMVQTKKVKNIELSDVLSTERDIVSIIKTNNPFYNSGKEELLHSQDKTKSNIQKIIVEKAKKALLKKLSTSTSTSTKGGTKPKKGPTIDSCYKSVLEYEKKISKIKYFNKNSIRNQKFDLNNYDPTKDDLTGIIENKSRKEQSIKDFGTVKEKLKDFKKGFLSKLKPGDIPSMTNPEKQIDKWFKGVNGDTVNQFEVDTVVPFIIYYYLYSGEQHMRTMQKILIVQDKLDWKKGEEEIQKKKKAFIDLLQKKAKDVIMEHIQERRDEMISLGDLQDFEILQKSRVIMNILSDETKTEKVRLKMANMLESIVTNSLLDSKYILIHNEQNPMIQVLHDLFTGETNKEMKKAILKIVAGFLCHTEEVYKQIVGKEIRSHEKQSKLVKMCLYILKDLDDTADKTYAKNMLVYYYERITKDYFNKQKDDFNKQETVIKTVKTISTEIGYNDKLDLRDDTFRADCKSDFNQVFLKKFITEKAKERITPYLGKGNKYLQRKFEEDLYDIQVGIISKNDKIMRLAKILKLGVKLNVSKGYNDIQLLILRTYAVNGILKILENSGNDNTIRKKIIDTVKDRNLISSNPTFGRLNLRLMHFLCAIVADGYSEGLKLMSEVWFKEPSDSRTHLKEKLKKEIEGQSKKVLENLVKSTEMKQYMVTVYSKIGTIFTSKYVNRTIKRYNRVIRIAFEVVNAELGKKMKEANKWDFTAKELKAKLFNATHLKDVEFTASELKAAEFTALQLKTAGFTAIELKAAEFTAEQLKDALFDLSELKTAGFSATDLKEAEFTDDEILAAGYNATDLKAAGFTALQLKTAKFTKEELKAAGFTALQLKNAFFSLSHLKEAGFTALELKNAGFTASRLKGAGFTKDDLSIAGFENTHLNLLFGST